MGIGYVVAVYLEFIAFDFILGYGVDYLIAASVLIQIFKLPRPIISCGYCFAFCVFSICKQVDFDWCRSCSVLIVVIVPCLGTAYFDFFRIVSIGYIIRINFWCIAFDFILGDGILYFYTAISILFQIIKCPRPIVCFSYRLTIHGYSISKQVNSYWCGTDFVLIVVIIPCLWAGNNSLFRRIFVFNSPTVICSGNSRYIRWIVRYNLFNCVLDRLIIFVILRKICEGISPTVSFIQCNRFTCFLAISKKLNRYRFRSLAVSVIIIIPILANGNNSEAMTGFI